MSSAGSASGRPATERSSGLRHLAAVDQADVAGGAAHVEAEHAGLTGELGEQQCPTDAAGGAGEHGQGGVRGGACDVGEPAGGLHDLRLGEALLASGGGEPAQVALEQRRERGVECGGGGALVLAEGADKLAGQRHGHAGQELREQLAEHALVARVGVGVQQRDGDCLGPSVGDALHERSRGAGIERAQNAVGGDPLGRGEAQLGGDERSGSGVAQPVEVRARLAAELDHVGEAVGGDQRGARRLPLQQGVGRDGHAVGEAAHVAGLRAGPLQHERDGLQHADGLLAGGRGHLGGVHLGIAVGICADEHGVGEGAADIDSEEHGREPTPGPGNPRGRGTRGPASTAWGAPLLPARMRPKVQTTQAAASSRSSVSARCWWEGQ